MSRPYRPSLSVPALSPGKVPSPSQLSVTELPGDEVQLEWAAAAASGVLVYQIKWTPLGDGKAREVWCGERKTTLLPPSSGRAQTLALHPGAPASPRPVGGARTRTPVCRAHTCPFSPQISVPGNLGMAVLPGFQSHLEYEITILAYYRDGARSDPVSLRYTPGR